MNIIAHRGDHTVYPENTLPAFQATLDAGAYGFEFDVRLTTDCVPVVFHYFSLLGTTAAGFLRDYTYQELQQVRVLAHDGASELYAIPTLREVLETFGAKTYLELHIQPATPEVSVIVGDMLNEYPGIWPMLEVTSYEPAILQDIQARCAGIQVDLLFPRSEPWMTPEIVARLAVDKARLANARAVHLHPSQLSPSVIDLIRAHDLAVHSWDIDDLATRDTIRSLGVEQFTTDNIHLFFG